MGLTVHSIIDRSLFRRFLRGMWKDPHMVIGKIILPQVELGGPAIAPLPINSTSSAKLPYSQNQHQICDYFCSSKNNGNRTGLASASQVSI